MDVPLKNVSFLPGFDVESHRKRPNTVGKTTLSSKVQDKPSERSKERRFSASLINKEKTQNKLKSNRVKQNPSANNRPYILSQNELNLASSSLNRKISNEQAFLKKLNVHVKKMNKNMNSAGAALKQFKVRMDQTTENFENIRSAFHKYCDSKNYIATPTTSKDSSQTQKQKKRSANAEKSTAVTVPVNENDKYKGKNDSNVRKEGKELPVKEYTISKDKLHTDCCKDMISIKEIPKNIFQREYKNVGNIFNEFCDTVPFSLKDLTNVQNKNLDQNKRKDKSEANVSNEGHKNNNNDDSNCNENVEEFNIEIPIKKRKETRSKGTLKEVVNITDDKDTILFQELHENILSRQKQKNTVIANDDDTIFIQKLPEKRLVNKEEKELSELRGRIGRNRDVGSDNYIKAGKNKKISSSVQKKNQMNSENVVHIIDDDSNNSDDNIVIENAHKLIENRRNTDELNTEVINVDDEDDDDNGASAIYPDLFNDKQKEKNESSKAVRQSVTTINNVDHSKYFKARAQKRILEYYVYASDLVKLIPEEKIENCLRSSTNCESLAKNILNEIFRLKTLGDINENTITVVTNFVREHGIKMEWYTNSMDEYKQFQ